jgi:hypothetical protein
MIVGTQPIAESDDIVIEVVAERCRHRLVV